MSSQAIFAVRVSAGFHVCLLVAAGLALTASTEPVHVHLVRGVAVWEASFASPEVGPQTFPALALPATAIGEEPRKMITSELQAAVTTLRRASLPIEASTVRIDLPKLPEELEHCKCDAPEHALQTPKRRLNDDMPPVEFKETPPPPMRPKAVADLTVSTEVELPSNPANAGSDVDELPKKLASNLPPPYPADAYRRGQQGRLVLEVHVNADGFVESLRVVESSGVLSLDQSALDTVRGWRFEPARRGRQMVAATVNVPIRFTIRP